jgi:hypothetical protein
LTTLVVEQEPRNFKIDKVSQSDTYIIIRTNMNTDQNKILAAVTKANIPASAGEGDGAGVLVGWKVGAIVGGAGEGDCDGRNVGISVGVCVGWIVGGAVSQ